MKKAKRTTRKSPAPKPKVKTKAKAKKKPPAPKAKKKSPAPKAKKKPPAAPTRKWIKFVEQHGVVLASARGPVPSIATEVAGEPIVGSWWSHAKAHAIFDALSSIDDSLDIRCFKLIDHKITFVHRRLWPALARLAHDGVIALDRVQSIQQEHMPTGEHRNFTTPYPDWVPDDVARLAQTLDPAEARAQLGPWVDDT